MIKNIIAAELITPPDTIQFAKDRKYEEAWIFKTDEEQPGVAEIEKYLSDGYETLIVEFIWNNEVSEKRFVLTIFNDYHKRINDFELIINSFSFATHYSTFSNFIKDLDEAIVGREYFLTHEVDAVKMSIFNFWLSSSPIDVWDRSEQFDLDLIDERIRARSDIMKTDLNYQGLLFMFNKDYTKGGPYYGLKTPCCHKNGKFWEVDIALLNLWVKKLVATEI